MYLGFFFLVQVSISASSFSLVQHATHLQNTRVTTAALSSAVNTPNFFQQRLHISKASSALAVHARPLPKTHSQHTKLSSIPLP